jgi:hypothetical protein
MSVRASSWVWDFAQAGGTALIVLLAIADYADDQGIGFPSIATLARKARLDERTVQRIIRRLVDTRALEVLEATAGGRRSNTYRLIMTRPDDQPGSISTPPADRHPRQAATGGVTVPGQGWRNRATAGVAQLRHPNVIEPSSNVGRGAALPPPVGVDRCAQHLGQPAATCGPCRAEAIAGGAA